jgi:SAM-dependent methyltransferase
MDRSGSPSADRDTAQEAASATPEPGTQGVAYTERLMRLQMGRVWWKRLLPVDLPYRWNVRHLCQGERVLDIGCGIGRNLAYLQGRGVGVDHNPHSVAVCRMRGFSAFGVDEFARSDHAVNRDFDCLLVSHVLEHMPRAQAIRLLNTYLAYLASRARVILICPQRRGYDSDPTHCAYLDLDALSGLADAVGLEPVERRSFPFPLVAGRWFTYNEFVLIADRRR